MENSPISAALRHESERTAGALPSERVPSEARPAGCKQGKETGDKCEPPPEFFPCVSISPFFQFGTSMGLISDLLRDSPLKPEQLENIAVIEKRMQDEKLSANRELDR